MLDILSCLWHRKCAFSPLKRQTLLERTAPPGQSATQLSASIGVSGCLARPKSCGAVTFETPEAQLWPKKYHKCIYIYICVYRYMCIYMFTGHTLFTLFKQLPSLLDGTLHENWRHPNGWTLAWVHGLRPWPGIAIIKHGTNNPNFGQAHGVIVAMFLSFLVYCFGCRPPYSNVYIGS